jgi:mannose/fructose/N-acetylgalactosamine-specific phosphotransferase system component IIC
MFLYLGIGLVVLAVVAFPVKLPIQAQPGDVDYFGIGWLFAPIIGIWGLASIVLGLVQSSSPKRTVESYLLPLLAVVTVGLAYATYMVVVFGSGIIHSIGRGEPFWWLYFGLVLAPASLIYSSAIRFLKSKEKTDFLTNEKVRTVMFVGLAAVPLSYTAIFLLLIYLL